MKDMRVTRRSFVRMAAVTAAAIPLSGALAGCSNGWQLSKDAQEGQGSGSSEASGATSGGGQQGKPSGSGKGEGGNTGDVGQKPASGSTDKGDQAGKGDTGMIFINSSRNKNGNTASMGRDLLSGLDYEQINLIDYKIYPLGQSFADDQFDVVWEKMCAADTIVIGTPVYWHTMAGSLKLLIDRMYEERGGDLDGKRLAFFAQGAGPTEMSLENLAYTFERVAANYGMVLVGTATNSSELRSLKKALASA